MVAVTVGPPGSGRGQRLDRAAVIRCTPSPSRPRVSTGRAAVSWGSWRAESGADPAGRVRPDARRRWSRREQRTRPPGRRRRNGRRAGVDPPPWRWPRGARPMQGCRGPATPWSRLRSTRPRMAPGSGRVPCGPSPPGPGSRPRRPRRSGSAPDPGTPDGSRPSGRSHRRRSADAPARGPGHPATTPGRPAWPSGPALWPGPGTLVGTMTDGLEMAGGSRLQKRQEAEERPGREGREQQQCRAAEHGGKPRQRAPTAARHPAPLPPPAPTRSPRPGPRQPGSGRRR